MKKTLLLLLALSLNSFAGFWYVYDIDTIETRVDYNDRQHLQTSAIHDSTIYVIYQGVHDDYSRIAVTHDLGETYRENPTSLEHENCMVTIDPTSGHIGILGTNSGLYFMKSEDSAQSFTEPFSIPGYHGFQSPSAKMFYNNGIIDIFVNNTGQIFRITSEDDGETFSDLEPITSDTVDVFSYDDVVELSNGEVILFYSIGDYDSITNMVTISENNRTSYREFEFPPFEDQTNLRNIRCEEYNGELYISFTILHDWYVLKSTDYLESWGVHGVLKSEYNGSFRPQYFFIENDAILAIGQRNGPWYEEWAVARTMNMALVEDTTLINGLTGGFYDLSVATDGKHLVVSYALLDNSFADHYIKKARWVDADMPTIEFTSQEDDTIWVPKNEDWYPNLTHTITWKSENVDRVTILQYTGKYDTLEVEIENTGSYEWTVPDTIHTGSYDHGWISIIGHSDLGEYFNLRTNRDFRIYESTIPILETPNLHQYKNIQLVNNRLFFATSANYEIEVFSARGQLVRNISGKQRAVSLNSLGLAKGVYQIRVAQGVHTFNGQFITK